MAKPINVWATSELSILRCTECPGIGPHEHRSCLGQQLGNARPHVLRSTSSTRHVTSYRSLHHLRARVSAPQGQQKVDSAMAVGLDPAGPSQGERQRAGHLFGPLLIRSPNPRFLHGPFPVGDMERPFSGWGYELAPFRLRTKLSQQYKQCAYGYARGTHHHPLRPQVIGI